MSGTVQPIQDIRSMSEVSKASGASGKKSAEQQEYEEGKLALENGEFGQAAVSLHNALRTFEEKGDENGIANASNQLGNFCLQKKDYDTALKHFQRAYSICDKANDRMSVIAVVVKRVDVFVGMQEYEKAIDDCLFVLDLYQDNRDPQGVVGMMEKMAEIYVESGDTAKAADTYRTIASIHSNYQHKIAAKKYNEMAEELAG